MNRTKLTPESFLWNRNDVNLESVAVEVNLNIGELGAMVIKVVVTQVEVCVANVRSKLLLVVLF